MKTRIRKIIAVIIFLFFLLIFVDRVNYCIIEKRDWIKTTAEIEWVDHKNWGDLHRWWVYVNYVDENGESHLNEYLHGDVANRFRDYKKVNREIYIGKSVDIIYNPETGENCSCYYLSCLMIASTLNLLLSAIHCFLCFKTPDRRYIREFVVAFFKKFIFKYFLQIASVLLLIWSVSGLVSCCQKLIDVQDWITKDAVVIRAGAPWEDVTVRFLDEAGNEELQKLQMLHYGVIYEYAHSQHKDVEILYNPDTGDVAKYSRVIFNTVFFTLCWLGSSWFCMWSFKRLRRKEIN